MRRFFQAFSNFMHGRYGSDTLNNCLIGLLIFLWLVNVFVFNFYASLVIDLFEIAVLALVLFRSFSRNINKRSLENRKFLPFYNRVKNWIQLNIRKFKERKDYRYIKCPACKAQLRVRNQKGKHTVHCPKCNYDFEKRIR